MSILSADDELAEADAEWLLDDDGTDDDVSMDVCVSSLTETCCEPDKLLACE